MSALVALAVLPSLAISLVAGFAMRKLAPRWNLVDPPGDRKIHARVTPYGGGIAIWAALVLPLVILDLALAIMPDALGTSTPDAPQSASWLSQALALLQTHRGGLLERAGDLWFFLGGATVLMFLGLADDRRKLDWRLRLAVETAVAAAVVFGRGWTLTLFVNWPLVTAAASVLWIVWLINSFNMLDNMDGLSAGVAAISACLLAIVMLGTPEPDSGQPQLFVAGFLFLLVGALVGFLFHNRPPARLFMGDAGAYLVGYCLAVMSILATFTGGGLPRHAILAPLCVFAIPIYDTLSVITIRLFSGRSPFQGDTSHFSHRLVALGLSPAQAVLTIYLASAACGLGALLLHQVDAWGAAVVLLMIFCLLCVIATLELTALNQRKNARRSR
ncbi:MAG TPA: MraY family glycosyltransferase [Pirellulales bacterium]|jgi:UDP-GlcNAc:undecaprenyl-phosphate GlcNAc-1-phosphate transferase